MVETSTASSLVGREVVKPMLLLALRSTLESNPEPEPEPDIKPESNPDSSEGT